MRDVIVYTLLLVTHLAHVIHGVSILKYVREGYLYNTTKDIFQGFTRNNDLTSLFICHVFPPEKIYTTLGSIFLNSDSSLKDISSINLDRLRDFKQDLFKVHGDSAFLREVDMPTKARFYGLNANIQDQVGGMIDRFKEIQDKNPKLKVSPEIVDDEVKRTLKAGPEFTHATTSSKIQFKNLGLENPSPANNVYFRSVKEKDKIARDIDYLKNITTLTSLFYNAPANLRVTNSRCINDQDEFEDPSLRSYTENAQEKDNKAFTQHSRYLAQKYTLFMLKDNKGNIKTTDTTKALRKRVVADSEKIVESNVFDMFFKNSKGGMRKTKQLD